MIRVSCSLKSSSSRSLPRWEPSLAPANGHRKRLFQYMNCASQGMSKCILDVLGLGGVQALSIHPKSPRLYQILCQIEDWRPRMSQWQVATHLLTIWHLLELNGLIVAWKFIAEHPVQFVICMNSSKCGNPAIPEVCCVLSSLLSWTWNSYQNNSNIHHRPEDLSIRLLEKVCSIASQNTVGTPLCTCTAFVEFVAKVRCATVATGKTQSKYRKKNNICIYNYIYIYTWEGRGRKTVPVKPIFLLL